MSLYFLIFQNENVIILLLHQSIFKILNIFNTDWHFSWLLWKSYVNNLIVIARVVSRAQNLWVTLVQLTCRYINYHQMEPNFRYRHNCSQNLLLKKIFSKTYLLLLTKTWRHFAQHVQYLFRIKYSSKQIKHNRKAKLWAKIFLLH